MGDDGGGRSANGGITHFQFFPLFERERCERFLSAR
jgi:hypothetical protein